MAKRKWETFAIERATKCRGLSRNVEWCRVVVREEKDAKKIKFFAKDFCTIYVFGRKRREKQGG